MSERDERTCYIGNLSSKITEDLLEELFTQVGPLDKVTLKSMPTHTFAMVTFTDEESVPFAIETLDGVKLFGTAMQVKPKSGSQQELANRKRMDSARQDRNQSQSFTPSHMDDRKRDHMGLKPVREADWRQSRTPHSATPNSHSQRQSYISPAAPFTFSNHMALVPPPPPPMSLLGNVSFTTPHGRPQPGYKVPSGGSYLSSRADSWHYNTPPTHGGLGDRRSGRDSRDEPRRSFPPKERDEPRVVYDRRDGGRDDRDYRDSRDRNHRSSSGGGSGGNKNNWNNRSYQGSY